MSLSNPVSRREALAQLSALLAVPLVEWPSWYQPGSDVHYATIAQYQAGRLRGDYTALEVTARLNARCRTIGMDLRAIDLLAASALDEARASDARQRGGTLRGPLDGVPLFAKSIYDMQGLATTASSAEWKRLFPQALSRDAIEVTRLRAAGAVLLGKTAADDFAYRGNGTSSATGQVINPYDARRLRTPGGSSAGSAVAVASGMGYCALGTDDGGSNRIPAQFTGVVGVKPTFGLVPRSGVIPTWPVLDTHGPLARSVADAALMLDAIAGYDADDGLSLRSNWRAGTLRTLNAGALRGARLGFVELHAPRSQMTADCLRLLDAALADCTNAGAIVERYTPPVDRVSYREQFATFAKERGDVPPNANAPAATANALRRYFERQGVNAIDAVQRGLASYRAFYDVLPADWEAMVALMQQPYEQDASSVSFLRSRARAVSMLAQHMREKRIDAMVYPTMPFQAPNASEAWPDVRTPLGYGNWLGLPEISVPAGYGTDGMPGMSLSFVGLPGSDAPLLSLAHAFEGVSGRFRRPAG